MAYAEPMPPRMGLKTVLFRFACYKHVAPTELANEPPESVPRIADLTPQRQFRPIVLANDI